MGGRVTERTSMKWSIPFCAGSSLPKPTSVDLPSLKANIFWEKSILPKLFIVTLKPHFKSFYHLDVINHLHLDILKSTPLLYD